VKAMYAGSFDPLTNGHLWVIAAASNIFEEIVIGVGYNPAKSGHLPLDRRISIIQHVLIRMGLDALVIPVSTDTYLVHKAARRGCGALIRGVRNSEDLRYEQMVQEVNRNLEPDVQTVFLVPPPHLANVSSSLVRQLVGPGGWENIVNKYAPMETVQALAQARARAEENSSG